MIKSAELKGPSCLTKSADDEPLFVLCARDVLAPHVVRQWAHLYAQMKTNGTRSMTAKEKKKYNDAMGAALMMELYQSCSRKRSRYE
jgi:hypothetical protein